MKGTAQKLLEDRLSQLEHRMSLIDAGKKTAQLAETENVLSLVGLSFLLKHLNEKVMAHPQYGDYDDYLKGIFKAEITPQNRLEYAEKVSKLSLDLLDDAIDIFKNRKAEHERVTRK